MGLSDRLAFIFICQSGPLEIKSALLASSLRRYLGADHELIAAVPTPVDTWGAPSPRTLKLLEALRVRMVPVENQVDVSYAAGNKVACLAVPTDAERLVFLDSDLLLVRPFPTDPPFTSPFAARPVDLPGDLEVRHWRRAYAAASLPLPQARIASTVHRRLLLPCFDSGFLAVDPRAGLGEAWLDCCRRIERRWGIPEKRPHLDQIALPVALEQLGLQFECLPESYNAPVHLEPIDAADPPLFAHYHEARILRREPVLRDLARSLCQEHPPLAEMLAADPEHAPLLANRPARASVQVIGELAGDDDTRIPARPTRDTPELIITGIPRSGTSYLCNLLHRFENCVVLNEPDSIARPLRKQALLHRVAAFYRDVRRDVLEGKPIRNKLRDGKVTDETVGANELVQYTPAVANERFVLAVKNPLAFLARLRDLRRAMPRARVVLCVRNPFDTIASWKTTFSHLESADVAGLVFGGLRDKFLSHEDRAALTEIARIKQVAWRRAAWWRYLAEQVLQAAGPAHQQSGGEVILVPYPVVTADPMSVVTRVLSGYEAGELREPIQPSATRAAKRSALDAEDVQAIRALCSDVSASLGLAVPTSLDISAPSR